MFVANHFGNMVEINGLAIFRCFKEQDSPETLGIIDASDIENPANETIRDVSQRLVGNLIDDPNVGRSRKTPKYGRSKSARIHEFGEEATVERENGLVTKTVLEELRDSTDLETNGEAVAEWYLTETQSRSDLLLIVPYEFEGHEFVAIIKTPYLDDAYETDPTEILKEAERVIQRKTHKGLIYPCYEQHDDTVDTDRAKVYQSSGSYSDYWWGFLRLLETKVDDEELVECVADGRGPFPEVGSTEELDQLPNEVDNQDLLDAKVKLEISGIELAVSLGDLTDGSTVRLAKKDGTYFVILTGGEPDIQAVDQNDKHAVFPDLNEFEELDDVLAQYL